MKPLQEIVPEFDTYLGIGAFESILWHRTSIQDELYDSTAELDLRSAIAAQHLGLWQTAQTFAQQWATQTGKHRTEGPKITVVIPTFNRPSTLERTLKSVCNQLYRPLEIVVVNDAGKPVSSIIDRYRESREIIEVNNPQNLYLAGSRNQGIRHATGTYVNFLDDDDQIYPHHIGHLLFLAESSELPASQALSLRQTEGRTLPHELDLIPQVLKPFELSNLLLENSTPVQTVLLKRNLFDTIGYFNERFLACEDWDQWLRLRSHTAIAQSSVFTSWVEGRNLDHRMSISKRASFLGARARIYNPPSSSLLPTPTSDIVQKQRERLQKLGHAIFEEITATQSVTLGLVGPHTSSKLDTTIETEWGDYFHPVEKQLIEVNSFQEALSPSLLAQELRRLAENSSNFCILVEEDLMVRLAPGWGTALIGHLTGEGKRLGACPQTEFIQSLPQHIGSSTILTGAIPGCIVLKTQTVLELADYAHHQSSNLSLNQLILNHRENGNHSIVQAKEIGFGSPSSRPQWLTNSRDMNIANRFKLENPPFPWLKARYDLSQGEHASPKVLNQHLRYLNSNFALFKNFCPDVQHNPNERRARLTIEFVCSQETFERQLQPLLELASIPPNCVAVVQEPAETPPQYDGTIECDTRSLSNLQEEFQRTLIRQTPEKTYFSPKSNSLKSAILVSFTPNEKTEKELEECVTQLRKHHPGIDIAWVVPSFEDSRNLIAKYKLRAFMLPLPWLEELAKCSSESHQTIAQLFFQIAEQLFPISQCPIPAFYPVGVPHYISSLFWWVSRANFLVFTDLPSPQNRKEEAAIILASLLTTLCLGEKFSLQPTAKDLSGEGVSGLYSKTCANLPTINLAQKTNPLSNSTSAPRLPNEKSSKNPKNLWIVSRNYSNSNAEFPRGLAYIHDLSQSPPPHSRKSSHQIIEVDASLHPDLMKRARHYANSLCAQDRWPAFFKGKTIFKEDFETLVNTLFEVEICTHVLTNLNPEQLEGISLSETETQLWESLCEFQGIPWKGSTRPKPTNLNSPFDQEIETVMRITRNKFGVPPFHEISNSPLVSVIVPTYDRPNLLKRALQSIQDQTMSDFEIIVINDGTVPVEEVVQEFTQTCKITLINHDKNRGLPAARNSGLKVAIGQFIAYLDDDDIFLPHHLELGTKSLQESDCRVLYSNTERSSELWEDGKLVRSAIDSPYNDPFSITHLFVKNPWPVLSLIHERSCLQIVGLQDESLTTHEDWDFNIRLGLCFKVLRIQETTGRFTARHDGMRMTNNRSFDFVRTTRVIYERYHSLAKHLPYVLELQLQHAAGIQSPFDEVPEETLRSIAQMWQHGNQLEALQLVKERIQRSNAADAIALSARMLWDIGRMTSARRLILKLTESEIARIVEPAIFIQSLNACGLQATSLKYISQLTRKSSTLCSTQIDEWYNKTLHALSQQLREVTIESLKNVSEEDEVARMTEKNFAAILQMNQ